MQKLRGARLHLSKITFLLIMSVVVGDLWLFCEQPAEGRRVDRVNRVDGIASLDGRDYQMSNE